MVWKKYAEVYLPIWIKPGITSPRKVFAMRNIAELCLSNQTKKIGRK